VCIAARGRAGRLREKLLDYGVERELLAEFVFPRTRWWEVKRDGSDVPVNLAF